MACAPEGGAYDGCDPTSAPANPDISSEGYCDTVGELERVAMAADVADQARLSDFGYDDAGNLTAAIQRGDPSAAPGAPAGPTDRATTTAYHPASGALVASIDGPRSDVADVTRYGRAGAPGFGYDASGQPATIADAAAKTTTLAYTPYGLTGARSTGTGTGAPSPTTRPTTSWPAPIPRASAPASPMTPTTTGSRRPRPGATPARSRATSPPPGPTTPTTG